ncbi:unnamed protein product, partial [Mesorhabditis belari]|uniref:Uncharacterized protein n=1 Tax=Mesorhabditis belari TaxID=2138241 RepID=A0AAF3FPQ6_9BILA
MAVINGLNFTVTGICRYIVLGSGHFHEPMTSRQCLFTTPWLIIMIIGETYPASMTLVVSLERFFASMLIAAILNVLFNVQTNADRQCGTTSG